MNKQSATGSMAVEASLIVPVFFLALIPFLYLIRICLSQAVLERALDEALRSVSVESYILLRESEITSEDEMEEETLQGVSELMDMQEEMKDAARQAGTEDENLLMDLAGCLVLRQKVLELLSDQDLTAMGIEGGEAGISFFGSRFFYAEGTHRHLLHAEMTVLWASPFIFFDPGESTFERTTHAFTGEKDQRADGNDSSSGETGQDPVVYRIGKGNHYHQADCFLIDKQIITISVSEAEQMGLSPCSRCRSDLTVTGLVLMTSGGEKYHRSSCGYLYPDLEEMTLSEALRLGLSPCGLCYGTEGYFR